LSAWTFGREGYLSRFPLVVGFCSMGPALYRAPTPGYLPDCMVPSWNTHSTYWGSHWFAWLVCPSGFAVRSLKLMHYREGGSMLSHDLIVAPTEHQPPAVIAGSGRKARRPHRTLPARRHRQRQHTKGLWPGTGSFFAIQEDGGKGPGRLGKPVTLANQVAYGSSDVMCFSCPPFR